MSLKNRTLDSSWQISQDEEIVIEPKGNDFWATSDDLCRLSLSAGTISNRSQQASHVADQSGALLSHFESTTEVLIRHGAKGYFWLAANWQTIAFLKKTIAHPNIVESKIFGKHPFDFQYSLGGNEVFDEGTICNKWRLFRCDPIASRTILMGVNNSEEVAEHYARIQLLQ